MPPRRSTRAFSLGLALVPGCGLIEYLTQVNSRTAAALVQAQREGAERSSPYKCAKATAGREGNRRVEFVITQQ